MAQAVFNSAVDVFPDINQQFLRTTIINMIADFGIAQIENANANLADIQLPDDVIAEFTMLVLDRLLNNGYQRHVEEPPPPPPPPVAVAGAAPVPEAAQNAQPVEWRSYRDDALQLLSNEFRWFYQNTITRAFKTKGNRNYTAARKLLQEVIKPFVGDFDMESVDPVHPSYPVKNIRTADREIVHPTHGRFLLLQNPRYSRPMVVRNPELQAEIDALYKLRESKDHSLAEEINYQEYENESMLIACQCCYSDTTFESLVACGEGHLFCLPCLKQYVNVKIEVGVRKGQLECMDAMCDATFPRSTLTSRLEPEALEKLDERIIAYNLNASGMSDLVRCPKCQMQFQLEPTEKVLLCASCKFASCRRCHEPWDKDHIGKTCEEVEGKSETHLRRAYEEEMSKAIIRNCPKCKSPIVKIEGCNKMSCPCGGTLCYVCRAPNIGYEHFCRDVRDPGKSCTKCSKCSLWVDPTKADQETVAKLEAEAHKKQQTEHEARAKKLLEEASTSERKRSLSSDIVTGETPYKQSKFGLNLEVNSMPEEGQA